MSKVEDDHLNHLVKAQLSKTKLCTMRLAFLSDLRESPSLYHRYTTKMGIIRITISAYMQQI